MPTPVTRDEFADIVVLPGDGIGPEITDAAISLLEAIGGVRYEKHPIGGCSIDAFDEALTGDVLARCRKSDGVILGAVGGPKWDTTKPGRPRPEDGLLELRKQLGGGKGLYANIRPVKPYEALLEASALKGARLVGTDLLIVRELTGGIYYGERGRRDAEQEAFDTCTYTKDEIRRVAIVAFETAQKRAEARGERARLTSIDKANVMETSRLWRETVEEIAGDYPDVQLDHMLVDNAAMQLVIRPAEFDVILAENTFGDILSDLAAALTGSLGMLPSASIDHYPPGLFEPIHGSAPDIAGRGIANPLGTLLSVAMMFRHGFGRFPRAEEVAMAIDRAVETVLTAGLRTPDLATSSGDESATINVVGTQEMTEAVIAALDAPADWTAGAIPWEQFQQELREKDPTGAQGELQPSAIP
jgi:3-isopropylmalate dehydrogenase